MTQRAIPFLLMRGGTSRGPYFRRADLPGDRDTLARVLKVVTGGGQPNSVDGVGGGVAVTTKVAMLSASEEEGIDVDYLFAQVNPETGEVDMGPTCGNILVGVGPAAIEMGLLPAAEGETAVRIRAVNTGARVEAVVRTPDGQVSYAGGEAIDGVNGTAAPVGLQFLDVVGSRTGAMFPTGHHIDVIEGTEVSCVDVAMPMMIARAADFGIEGIESPEELDANGPLLERIERLRLEAGRRMGLGDVSRSVVPKVALISPPRAGGHLAARYLMPWSAHPTIAITGSQCLTACALVEGTVADGIAAPIPPAPATVAIEHPSGRMEVVVDYGHESGSLDFRSAGVVRTARLIARGEVLVPEGAFE